MENKIELFAIVELFGHQRIAGVLTEQTIGGASFIRVDVPEIDESAGFTRMFHPNAIYAINPVTEEVMKASAQSIKSKPIQIWDAREMLDRIDTLKKLEAANKQISVPDFLSDDLDNKDDDDLPFDI